MAKKGCGQTVIPSVDSTELSCEEYISEDCIIISKAIPFIGSLENESLKDVIIKIVDKLQNQSKLIKQLRIELYNLKNN